MQTHVSPAPTFEPLPLRTRGVLELIDITIKIFRRYFWVLAGWSLVVVGSSSGVAGIGMLLGAVSAGGETFSWGDFAGTAVLSVMFAALLAFFLWPLILGAAACCIAAAVRGQSVTFKQCWQFTKPRYGQILGLFVASAMITWMAMIGYMLLCALIFGVGAFALQSVPGQVTAVLAIVAIVCFYVIAVVLSLVVVTWMFMVPMVPCLEGQVPSSGPLRRAWDLLRGQWRRALGLMFLLGVCLTALSFIMQAAAGLFTMFSGGPVSWGSLMSVSEGLSLVIYMALNTVTSVVTTPFMFLLIAMFYLDLRIRKEALDLEWSAHVATPQETSTGANAQSAAPQLESFGHRSGSEMQTGFAAAAFDSTGSVTTVPQALSAELVNTGLGSPQAQEPQRHGSQAQTPPVVAPMAQTRPLPVAQVDFPPGNQPQALTRTPQVAEQSSPVQPPVPGSEESTVSARHSKRGCGRD
jgi:hypothetical protein